MKKLILVLVLSLLIPGVCFAASTKIEGANGQTNSISNPLFVQPAGVTQASNTYITKLGDQVNAITGTATIYSVTMNSKGATDTLIFYDSETLGGVVPTEIIVEVEVGVANSTATVPFPGGVKVTKGVSVEATNNSVVYSIIYNQ